MIQHLSIAIAGAALGASTLLAQSSLAGSAFQPHGWMAAPGSTPMRIEGAQYGPVLGKPFSATEVRRSTQTLNDGTHVDHSDTSQFYRDGHGRMRAESPKRVEIFDPVAGFEYDLNPENKTYKKIPIPEKTASMSVAVVGSTSSTSFSSDSPEGDAAARQARRGQPRRSTHPQATEDLPPQVMNGVSVKGSRIIITIPVGTFGNDREMKVVNERWFSDELQALVKSSNSDPRFGVTTYELSNIVRVSPDPALFQVPADYTMIGDSKHAR